MRFLFVVPQFAGHVTPAVSVAMELGARGHEVAWAAPSRIRPLLPEDARLYPVGDEIVEGLRASFRANTAQGGQPNDLMRLWDDLVLPLARGTLADVERAVDDFVPAVLVVDQYALAGELAAWRKGLVWAMLSPTAFMTVDATVAAFPGVKRWVDGRLAELEREAGVETVAEADRSPSLVVAFSIPALQGQPNHLPAYYRCVGPAIEHRSGVVGAQAEPVWEELGSGPRVLVTLGSWSTYRRRGFFETTVEALGGLPLQAILIAPPELVPPAPENITVIRPYVNNLALFPHVDAVVSHGGLGTVLEALVHGLPLVISPFTFDHPVVAQKVADAGAGIRVKSVRTSAGELRAAVEAVLAEPRYREAAVRIRTSLQEAGGAKAAADALESLTDQGARVEVA